MTTRLYLEKKMESPYYVLFVNIVLTLILFLTGLLGNKLGLSDAPIPLSVVWPTTGFSLAALLLFGPKTWPAVLIGNFFADFLPIYTFDPTFWGPFFTSLLSSLTSLLEAFIAYHIMNKYCTPSYFNTVKDVAIFLIPAALLSSLIASFLGVLTLYAYDPSISFTRFAYMMMIYWVGDSMGMYIFTPLIVVWTLKEPFVKLRQFALEAFLMVLCFAAITFLNFGIGIPLGHFYIPLCLWVTYRFRMHGATLAILFISCATILPTALNYGPFVEDFQMYRLVILVTFLQMIIVSSLLLAALINERELAWHQLRTYNLGLEEEMSVHRTEMKEKIGEIFIKEKLVSIGMLSSGIAKQIQVPLKKMNRSIGTSLEILKKIAHIIEQKKEGMDSNLLQTLNEHLKSLALQIEDFSKYESQAFRIAKVIQEQSIVGGAEKIEMKEVNLNIMLKNCVTKALTEATKEDPNFILKLDEKYDKGVSMILAMPEDLAFAFILLIKIAINSLREKKARQDFKPHLELITKNYTDKIEILLKDNGKGISVAQLNYLVPTNNITPEIEDVKDFGFTLLRDIIVLIYKGQIEVILKTGQSEEFTITLPKEFHDQSHHQNVA